MKRGSTSCDHTMQTKRFTSWLTVALLAALVFAGQRSMAQSVTLAWDASASSNIVSYAVYYGTASRQYTVKTDVGNVTTATLRNLTPGLTYYFAATAIDSTGVESSLSTEVSYRVVTTLPAIQGLTSVTFSRNHSSGQVPFTLSFPLTSSNAVFSAQSSNPQLLPTSAVTFGGLGTNRWLSFTSGLDLFGSATLTVVLSDGITTNSSPLSVTVNPANLAPVVDAGTNSTARTNTTYMLRARATDDGVPSVPGRLVLAWSKVSGPGIVTFGNTNYAVTTVRFSANGMYRLRLTAFDGELTSFGEVVYRVQQITDTNAPILTRIEVAEVTENSITVNWTTDELSDGQLQYTVEGGAPLNTLINPIPTLSHTVTVSNLVAGAAYSIIPRSRDSAGNKGFGAPIIASTLNAASFYSAAPADGTLSVSSPQETAGFSVYVPMPGVFRTWLLVNGGATPSQTFSVSVDGAALDTFDPPVGGWQVGSPQWVLLNGRNGGAALSVNPRLIQMTAATHVVRVAGANSQSSILRVLITNDPNYVPGQDVASCCDPAAEARSIYATRVRTGWNLVAGQLESTGTTIADVLPTPPAGTVLYPYDTATSSFNSDVFDGSEWADGNLRFAPGEGAMIYNPESDFDWVVSGKVTASPVPVTSTFHTGANLVRPEVPKAGVIGRVLEGFAFKAGDTIQMVRSLNGDYTNYSFDGTKWDVVPVIDLGETFFLNLVAR